MELREKENAASGTTLIQFLIENEGREWVVGAPERLLAPSLIGNEVIGGSCSRENSIPKPIHSLIKDEGIRERGVQKRRETQRLLLKMNDVEMGGPERILVSFLFRF